MLAGSPRAIMLGCKKGCMNGCHYSCNRKKIT